MPLHLSKAGSSGTSTAWKEAIQRHLDRLSEHQKKQFTEPASPQECLAIIEKTRRQRRKTQRLLDFLRPVIEPLKRFEGAIDVVVQVNSGIVSPIWGPLRAGIQASNHSLCVGLIVTNEKVEQVVSEHYRALESMIAIIDRIVRCWERISTYEMLFQTNSMVQGAIGALYGDFLDFQTRVIRFYAASHFRMIFTSVEREFQEVVLMIDNHTRDADSAVIAADIAVSRLQDTRLEKRSILRWLSPATVLDDLERLSNGCIQGSGDWILSVPEFTSFFSSDSSRLASVQGPPGWGKSTIAAIAVNHSTTLGLIVLYFFHNADDPEKRTLVSLFRTLLWQLLQKDDSIFEVVRPTFESSGRPTADSLTDVQSALILALNQTKQTPIVIVIDAINESEDPEGLYQWIRCLLASQNPRLLILCTDRQTSLPALFSLTPEASEERSAALRSYIHNRALSIPYLVQAPMDEEVVTSIFQAAQGVWLNARLVMDEIERLPTGTLRTRKLGIIPVNLNNLYTYILRSIEDTLSSADILLAQQLFLWIDLEDYLPPYLVVGYEFFQHETLQLCFQFVNKSNPVQESLAIAYRLGVPLLEASNTAKGPDHTVTLSYEIRYTHHTAKDFIHTHCVGLGPDVIPKVLKPRRMRGLHRAEVALWYYTNGAKTRDDLDTLRSGEVSENWPDSYMEMSYGLWGALQLIKLPSDLDSYEITTALKILEKLEDFLKYHCYTWVEMDMRINYRSNWPHLLHLAVNSWEHIQSFTPESIPQEVVPALESFHISRLEFLQAYIHVLWETGPRCEEPITVTENACNSCFHSITLYKENFFVGSKRIYELGLLVQREAAHSIPLAVADLKTDDAAKPVKVNMGQRQDSVVSYLLNRLVRITYPQLLERNEYNELRSETRQTRQTRRIRDKVYIMESTRKQNKLRDQ